MCIFLNSFPISVDVQLLDDLLDVIREQPYLKSCSPVHLSLLRGHFALRHHQISPFVRLVRETFCRTRSVSLCLSTLRIFANENKTKHFLCLCSPFCLKDQPIRQLHSLIVNIRQSLLTIDPSCELIIGDRHSIDDFVLHTSLAWTTDKSINELQQFVTQAEVFKIYLKKYIFKLKLIIFFLTQDIIEPVAIKIQKIHIKIGNQSHEIDLVN
jgi:hypothetical protein